MLFDTCDYITGSSIVVPCSSFNPWLNVALTCYVHHEANSRSYGIVVYCPPLVPAVRRKITSCRLV